MHTFHDVVSYIIIIYNIYFEVSVVVHYIRIRTYVYFKNVLYNVVFYVILISKIDVIITHYDVI